MASGFALLNIKCIDIFIYILIQSLNTHAVCVVFACQIRKAQCFRQRTLHSSCWVKCVYTTLGLLSSLTHDINKPFVSVSEARPQIFRDLQMESRVGREGGSWELFASAAFFLVVPVTCTQSSHRPHTYGCLKPLGHLDRQAQIDKQMEKMMKHRRKNKKRLTVSVAPKPLT